MPREDVWILVETISEKARVGERRVRMGDCPLTKCHLKMSEKVS